MEVIDIQAIKDCIVKETIKTIEKALVENSIETTSGLTVIETQKAIDIIRQQLSEGA